MIPEVSVQEVRRFRFCNHHLDKENHPSDAIRLVGACGMQNTPPGAWEEALYHRAPSCKAEDLQHLLSQEKSLLQAWSLRGSPYIFPAEESDVFLSSLLPEQDEPWIYTAGIGLALDYLQMEFAPLHDLLKQVLPRLDEETVVSKRALDKRLSEWMLPFLPVNARDRWLEPSMYSKPGVQTVGGAVVSFLLRPCSFQGLVVFGDRIGVSPSFTSYRNWTGGTLKGGLDASKKLARKFVHCYGPTTAKAFESWLGCSGKQARRIFQSIADELEPVRVLDKKGYLLKSDLERFFSPPAIEKKLMVLGPHDPYLEQRDRTILLPEKKLHRRIWKHSSNPAAVLFRGEIIGSCVKRTDGKEIEVKYSMWKTIPPRSELHALAASYAAFRDRTLGSVHIEEI